MALESRHFVYRDFAFWVFVPIALEPSPFNLPLLRPMDLLAALIYHLYIRLVPSLVWKHLNEE